MTPPPGGPRDWSPPEIDARPVSPGRRPIRGAGHVDGLAWARGFAWTSLGFAVATLACIVLVPLAGQLGRVAMLAFFATVSVWSAFMSVPRYRYAGRRATFAIVGAVLGIIAFALVCYIALVFVLAGYGTDLPGLPNWWAGAPVGVGV
jgi:hypothetical protein